MNDNFTATGTLFVRQTEGEFVFQVQIIKRRKENPDMEVGAKILRRFYLYKEEDLYKFEAEIKELCRANNARAYIGTIGRKVRSVAFQMQRLLTTYIEQEDYKSARIAFDKAFGHKATAQVKRKFWVIDIDTKDVDVLNEVRMSVVKNYIFRYETPNGFHILATPFNKMEFKSKFPEHEIKDNMLLYY
jgi:hypothetical protein